MTPQFGSWVIVTDNVYGRKMRDRGLVTEVTPEDELVEGECRVVFEDAPDGVHIPTKHLTTDMQWLPPWEESAIAQVSELLRKAYDSQRPKRDRIAREIYYVMSEIFGESHRPLDPE